jgi:hypothetical protein
MAKLEQPAIACCSPTVQASSYEALEKNDCCNPPSSTCGVTY